MSEDEPIPLDPELVLHLQGVAGQLIDILSDATPHPLEYNLESVTWVGGHIRRGP
jgi:hypothetical protein